MKTDYRPTKGTHLGFPTLKEIRAREMKPASRRPDRSAQMDECLRLIREARNQKIR